MQSFFGLRSLTIVFLALAGSGTGGVSGIAAAGQYNSVISVGDAAPSWEALEGVDGKHHSRAETSDKAATVVVFTCNSCPYAVDVEDRLIWLHENYSPRDVAVVAINVNLIDEDSLPAMKEKAESKAFPFAYLIDPSQQIAKQFGAKFTPQCFVINQAGKVAYMGSMDDSPDGKQITQRYVAEALDAVLAGKNPKVTETVPIGCQIRFKRERRTRSSR
ncbi:thiol-disulfide oxidoreductase [Rubripirellula lacrimiformis]|uniref:Thiol-disulfide oxidoreductase n=2 Tax=Rubripirellula lacrimiformis TaxID=1930273 RepID=A0A517N7U7_9BACT|nr:thiol-disulfide oxidoreductase [Rubripirellula lacrimiformis]